MGLATGYDIEPDVMNWSGTMHRVTEQTALLLPQGMTFRDVHGSGYDVHLVLDLYAEGLRARSVEVMARDGSEPVDWAVFRRIRLTELVQAGAAVAMFGAPQSGEDRHPVMPSHLATVWSEPTDDALRAVAEVHRLAGALGLPENRFVEEQLGLDRYKAGYWIKRARLRGFLAPSKRSG